MTSGAIALLALGLAMDATAVSAARGLSVPRVEPRHVLLVALFFGGFQALMPLFGWMLGSEIGPFVAAADHWIAFGLLSGIGGKMIWDSFTEESEARADRDPFALTVMLVLAFATSVDALAAGISLPMLGAPLLESLVIIGLVTAVSSALGLWMGRRFGARLGRRLDFAGGLLLIGIGIKVLVDHLA